MIPNISNRIPPNYSTWETIEYSYWCAKEMIEKGIEGDFAECGVAAGNNLAAMCAAGRKGWGFDSFEGIPWAGDNDDIQPGMSRKTENKGLSSSGISSHSIEDVHANMKLWGIENYELIKGWFQDTLPMFKKRKLSILRLDGDLYESTIISLRFLYPHLSSGGFLIVDDWELYGCRKAFNDYFNDKKIDYKFDDGNVKYFTKP